jgi:hypothetical protein
MENKEISSTLGDIGSIEERLLLGQHPLVLYRSLHLQLKCPHIHEVMPEILEGFLGKTWLWCCLP